MISESVLERLARGSVRGLWNWPAMLPQVRAGLVRMSKLTGFPGAEYELTERGRRKMNHYRMSAAGLLVLLLGILPGPRPGEPPQPRPPIQVPV